MKKMHEKLEMLRKHFIQKVDLPTNRALTEHGPTTGTGNEKRRTFERV